MAANKRGSALISALFIMTLVAIAATAMSTRLQLDIYRTRLTLDTDELYLASQAVTFWAMDTLSNAKKPLGKNDNKDRLLGFPTKLQTIYPGVNLRGGLYDMQAYFNLNNLQDTRFHPQFLRLLENMLSNQKSTHKPLLDAIYYWISPYQPGRGHDEYLTFYAKQSPPYVPSYQPLQSISELRLIRGISPAIYLVLEHNVTVLPEVTAININTAPREVLMTLGNGLSEAQADTLIDERGKNGIVDMKDISEILQKFDIPLEQITIESQYFLSIATATSPDLSLTTYTLLHRKKDNKGNIIVGIINESLSTL